MPSPILLADAQVQAYLTQDDEAGECRRASCACGWSARQHEGEGFRRWQELGKKDRLQSFEQDRAHGGQPAS